MVEKIPDWVPEKASEIIPEAVAENIGNSDPEAQPFMISYQYYNDRECGLQNLGKNGPKKVLEHYRIIGSCSTTRDFTRHHIKAKSITNLGEYSKLFKHLPPDIDLLENIIQGVERYFYFVVDNIFYVVSISNSHYETDKVRR